MAAIGTTKRSPICFFTRSKHVSQWWDWCKEVASRTPTQQRVNACRCQQTESRFVPKTLTDPHPPLGIAGIWVFPSLCSIGLNFGSKGGYWKLPSMAFPHFSVIFDWTANSVTNRKRLYLGSASGTFPNSASSTLGRENTNPQNNFKLLLSYGSAIFCWCCVSSCCVIVSKQTSFRLWKGILSWTVLAQLFPGTDSKTIRGNLGHGVVRSQQSFGKTRKIHFLVFVAYIDKHWKQNPL